MFPVVALANVQLPESFLRRLRRVLPGARRPRTAAPRGGGGPAAVAGLRHGGCAAARAVTQNRWVPRGRPHLTCVPGSPGYAYRVERAQFASKDLRGGVLGHRRWSLSRCTLIVVFHIGAAFRAGSAGCAVCSSANQSFLTRRGCGYGAPSVPLTIIYFFVSPSGPRRGSLPEAER